MTHEQLTSEGELNREPLVAEPEHRESAIEMRRDAKLEVGIVLDDEEEDE